MTNIAYLSLGSNLGDRADYLKNALKELSNHPEIDLLKMSSIYETEPVGYTEQGNFLNIVVKIATTFSAEQLLDVCQHTEKELGRIRDIRWGPRTVDLDILLFNNDNIKSEKLIIPHPRMHERAFVLIPLMEIEPSIQLPTWKAPLNEILNGIPDKEGVRLWKQINGEDAFALFEN
ncbi:2-amino-4-hydroxy-6-hydroxymethyldihydropteridine diphosphokinase [Bacillus sp. FJAT-49736]|uniref:2-amino-4-hydroxy-6- hydroxymethyldihydropteridine diphosphokinase n=1 Tax=Bacillus sp. FJAT-49736 TaxID=2833582 RepID=UPI001BC9E6E4|nr:2-amino-4-hydroxy-6-hydroxymethyldihydropteridine diphosphokinase [Bacillus sp. FJAT-49736]MBS4175747.1 2-amino-4-hydroxy-6-hydroxymethyldihydropteridine diphosphokinase [Bacillus sp. FJAT-49736]